MCCYRDIDRERSVLAGMTEEGTYTAWKAVWNGTPSAWEFAKAGKAGESFYNYYPYKPGRHVLPGPLTAKMYDPDWPVGYHAWLSRGLAEAWIKTTRQGAPWANPVLLKVTFQKSDVVIVGDREVVLRGLTISEEAWDNAGLAEEMAGHNVNDGRPGSVKSEGPIG